MTPGFEDASESLKRPAPSPTNSTKSNLSSSKRSKSSKSPNSSTDKSSRGLRHFSMMVCKKVEERGTTTYNEVADELVKKVVAERESGKFDEKNIRRRVYDALNVLMAMDIISKDKKDITWRGLPTFGRQDLESVRDEVEYRQAQVQQKREALKELLVQQVCFRNLVWHNHQRESEERIPLPFVVVNTHASAVIQCDMSKDRANVMFEFSMPFEINDDNTILKKMGLDNTSMSVLREMLPEDLVQYCQDHRLLDAVIGHDQHQAPVHRQAHHHRAQEPHAGPPMHQHHPSHHQPQHHHSRGVYPQQHYSAGYDHMGP